MDKKLFRELLDNSMKRYVQDNTIEQRGIEAQLCQVADHLLTRIEELEAQVNSMISVDQHWQHIIQQHGIMISKIIENWPVDRDQYVTQARLKVEIAEALNAIEKLLVRPVNLDSTAEREADPDFSS